MGGTIRCGIVVLARSDPRLLELTLRSLEGLARHPDLVAVVVPPGRNHVFTDLASFAPSVPIRTIQGWNDWSALEQGLGSIATDIDIVMFAPEGIILDSDYLDILTEKASRWDDLVGEIDVVNRAIKLSVDAPVPALPDLRRADEWFLLPTLRRWWRARVVMPSILWVRVAACGSIKFVQLPEICDFIVCALFLDRLRCRGRTALLFSGRAHHLRLMPERRTGFEVGYALFSRLNQVAAYDDLRRLVPRRDSYLNERTERTRLLGEQALQFVLSPRNKRHVTNFLRGMWAARRNTKLQEQKLRREIRNLG